jgi:uncharacterized membrane protein YhaH (DUF805 family)
MLFSFQGRLSRKPFWLFTIVVGIAQGSVLLFDQAAFGNNWGPFTFIFVLITLWPSLAIQTKRWHDRDKSGFWILINIVPIIGPLWAFIENGFLKGNEFRNRFGENPLQR